MPPETTELNAAATVLKTATLAPKKHIRNAFQNSSDARSTITTFQRGNSLHCMFAKAFGTNPIHDKNADKVEPLDPSPVLEFLSHLNVTRHEVHSRVAAALRTAIEDEIQRMPIASNASSGSVVHQPLLNLLKSVWQFRDVPELRPILVCLLKRLGDHTPVQMLRRLGMKNVTKDGEKKDGELKNAELLSQLGPHMSRLVWEANWDERLEAVTARYAGQNAELSGPIEKELTLDGPTILADLINPSVQNYLNDPILVQSADQSFVASASERRCNTKSRRMKTARSGHVGGITVGALASIGGVKPSEEKEKTSPKEENSVRASAAAIASINSTIGSRPKLLGAVLDMLIAEYASSGGGLARIRTMSSDEKQTAIKDANSTIISILGGSTNLTCSLVSDILLTFGQLPREYEVLGIMAQILDAAVQAAALSDIAIVQVQGCLRSIFRPEHDDRTPPPPKSPSRTTGQESAGPKIKLKLKTGNPTNTFPDLPADDSEYRNKIIQRIVKAAIVKMKEIDYAVRFGLSFLILDI